MSEPTHRCAVLIVDDDLDSQEMVRLALDAAGYTVATAANGRDALGHLRSTAETCIIILDLTLPLMDGFAATKLIRQNDDLKTVPIIACTAHQEDDFRSVAKASGFDAYVTKPIDVNWLKELIAGLLI